MSRTFSNFLGKSLSDSTTSERKNTKARRARQRVITIKTRLSASQCEKFLVNFFFFFAQRNISKQDEQNDVGQKKFDLLWNFNVTACARNFTKFFENFSKDADWPYVYMFQISAQSDKSDFCRF